MIDVSFSQEFLREYRKLPALLQEDARAKIILFKDRKNHHQLRVHKLHGEHAGCWSFSVNYRFRIVFEYIGKKKNAVALITIGDHTIYD